MMYKNTDLDCVMCVFTNSLSWRPRDATCWSTLPVTVFNNLFLTIDHVMYVFRSGHSWRPRGPTCWRALPVTVFNSLFLIIDHVMYVFRSVHSWRPRGATCWRALPVTSSCYETWRTSLSVCCRRRKVGGESVSLCVVRYNGACREGPLETLQGS